MLAIMQKSLRYFLQSWLFIVVSPFVAAESQHRFVVHINDDFKIGELEGAVEGLSNYFKDADIRVVVIGKAVTRLLRTNQEAARIVNSINKNEASVGLCHNAISNHKVDPSMLVDGVKILKEGGNIAIIRLRASGYNYIKL